MTTTLPLLLPPLVGRKKDDSVDMRWSGSTIKLILQGEGGRHERRGKEDDTSDERNGQDYYQCIKLDRVLSQDLGVAAS